MRPSSPRRCASCDLTRPVINQGRRLVEPFDDRQRDAIRRLRVIDGTLTLYRDRLPAQATDIDD